MLTCAKTCGFKGFYESSSADSCPEMDLAFSGHTRLPVQGSSAGHLHDASSLSELSFRGWVRVSSSQPFGSDFVIDTHALPAEGVDCVRSRRNRRHGP